MYFSLTLCQTKQSWSMAKISKFFWSFCFELKVLNESKYWMPWVRCGCGNVLFFSLQTIQNCWELVYFWGFLTFPPPSSRSGACANGSHTEHFSFVIQDSYWIFFLTDNRDIFKECQRERKLHQSFLFVLFSLPLIVHLFGSSLTSEEWKDILLAFSW